jgi:cystathionine beta-lyase/cystathionine gamma-synthase
VRVAATAEGRRPSAASAALLPTAVADLRADFDELLFLCRGAEAKLAETAVELGAAGLREPTRRLLLGELDAARRRYRTTTRRLASLRERAERDGPSAALVEELAGDRAALADLLRAEQALTAALVGAADWQSPSFLHSVAPAAGRQAGRIRAHWNDYKRDRHLDAEAYERRFVEAMVDGPAGLRALLTSCGMAAFTTILSFLLMERKLEGPVLAGDGLYHESRRLLERALPGRVRFVDERDTLGLLHAIDDLHPSALFLDSLSNTTWMPVPELAAVVERLRGTGIYLVVDNTGLSVACQPFAAAGDSVRLLVFESLLKYAQLGLDRANAGVIVARPDDAELLSSYREHLGTNIADVAVHALPPPNRRVLERRLARLQRNALFLAKRLGERSPAAVVTVYPGLLSHPCARAAARLRFRGCCLSIVFRTPGRGLGRERALVGAAIAEAAKRGVALVAGSSFGFDTTRIYLTAARAECGQPFVRVAAGTEHRLALEPLAAALAAAVETVAP